MSDEHLREIADNADMIIHGYAFTCCKNGQIRALNLNKPHSAAVFSSDLEPLEMTMDDVELSIVKSMLERNLDLLVA